MGCAPYGLFLYKRYLVTLDGFLGFNGLGSRQLLRRSQRVLGHIQRQARLGAEFIDFDLRKRFSDICKDKELLNVPKSSFSAGNRR